MAAGGVGAGGGQFLRRLDQPRLPRLQRQLDTDVGRARVTRRGGRVGFRSAPTWELFCGGLRENLEESNIKWEEDADTKGPDDDDVYDDDDDYDGEAAVSP